MSVKVFIDGSSGTTGLRIADRLAARPDIELLSISAEGRKDVNERAKVINSADLAFLCLPDAASKEVMPLLRPDVRVLDTSTAFRTDAAWDYGFPELKGQKEKIKNSYRVAVPGCYASGFISIARPLVELGLAPADYPFSCTGISGYSGGGKKMIAEYESADRPAHSKLDAPKSYGLGLAHKHLPEMQKISGLAHTPAFVPVVCDYYSGMQVLVPLDLKLAGTFRPRPQRAASREWSVLQRPVRQRQDGAVHDRQRGGRPDDAGVPVRQSGQRLFRCSHPVHESDAGNERDGRIRVKTGLPSPSRLSPCHLSQRERLLAPPLGELARKRLRGQACYSSDIGGFSDAV